MNALCWSPPESSRSGVSTRLVEPDAGDGAGDDVTIRPPQRPEHAARRQATGRHHLANGGRCVPAEERPLRQVSDPRPATPARCTAEDVHGALEWTLQPEDESEERRLAAAVRAGDGDELTCGDAQRDGVQNADAVAIGERDAVELQSGAGGGAQRHPRAFRSAARLSRISEK